jgi:uncharacterized repeat protein (TIGR01451 family)
MILIGLASGSRAAQPLPEPAPPHPLGEGVEELLFLDSNSSRLEPQQGVQTASIVPWSKLVFQSYRTGDWEIYTANGDGSQQVRRTEHSASDIAPRLNRGCDRIAFASDRDGNWEIYTMSYYGTELRRLTWEAATDGQPFWSPDGTKIAFRSYRDDQAEVYVMNADGSGQTRLTYDGGYDGMPAWSADGTKIAFVSDRSGGYRIWVMSADGSGQTQLSNQAISQHPIWSPDGNRIAYDSDGDGNGWQEIWLMNADGSSQHCIHGCYGFTDLDLWVGSWSPDGRYIAFTSISWIYYQGNWYWTTAYLDAVELVGAFPSHPRLSHEDTDWHPDWNTTDVQAPTSSVHALPMYSRGAPRVRWSGSDSGVAGIKWYDVQVRDTTTGSWTDWQVATTGTFSDFVGIGGHTYDFRSRATDDAHNVETWPAGAGDTQTTLYNWAAFGTVRDSRGAPVAGVTITTTPDAFVAAPSDSNGRYLAYVGDSASTYTLDWAKSGFGNLPSTAFAADLDAQVDAILPPPDNVIQNGGFEADDEQLTNWLVSGTLPTAVTTAAFHTGDRAASMGLACPYPCLTDPEAITATTGSSPELAADSQGNLHMLWSDSGSVQYSFRTPSGIWSSPHIIDTADTSIAIIPALAIDGQDILHAVWNVYPDLYYGQRLQSGQWTTPVVIASGGFHDVAADSQGGVHIVYWDYDSEQGNSYVYYLERLPDGSWESPIPVGAEDNDGLVGRVTVGPDDTLHILLRQDSQMGLFHHSRLPSGDWTEPEQLTELGGELPGIAAGPDGELHAFWIYDSWGYYANRPPSGLWSEPITLTLARGDAELAVDNLGVVHMVGCSRLYTELGTYYRRRLPDGQWTEPVMISGNDQSYPQVVIDPYGILHTAWEDWGDGGTLLWYQTTLRSAEASATSISQACTVSANSHRPTLSFMYELRSAVPACDSAFAVNITGGVTTTQVFSTTGGTPWSHEWVDLGAWAGQTVTVTFALQQAVGDAYALLALDDITVGSAYPDLWVSKSDVAALPGEQVTYKIAYGNQGSVAAEGVRITDTLPSVLVLTKANPSPIFNTLVRAWEWDIGDLPATSGPFDIWITGTIASKATLQTLMVNIASIGSASPEIEMTNNVALATIYVGRRVYMPVTMRGFHE